MSVFEDVRSRVGEEIGLGEWLRIDQERIDAFAAATNDHQWIHVDPDKAAQGPFGATIAHGFLTLSLIPELAPKLAVPGVRMGINYGLDRVRFITPVKVGSRIRARSKLVDVFEVEGGLQLKSEVTVEIEGSERPACVAETIARYYL
jgi:acyl dehydratase